MNSPKKILSAIASSPEVHCKERIVSTSNNLKMGHKEFRCGPDTFPLRLEKRAIGLRCRKVRIPKAKHLYLAVLCSDDPLWKMGIRSSNDQNRKRDENIGEVEDTAYELELPSTHEENGILSKSSLEPVDDSMALTVPAVDLKMEHYDNEHTPEMEQLDGHGREDSVSQVQGPGGRRTKALHFLIVDDVMMNRRMVHRVLSSHRHEVSQSTDGKDCLRVWEEITAAGGAVDVVLMDNSMPIMTG